MIEDIEINNKIGKLFYPYLQKAKKRLYIISPWISPTYTKLALEKKKKGLDVKVATTNNYVGKQKEAIAELLSERQKLVKEKNPGQKHIATILLILGVISFFMAIVSLFFILIGIILIIIAIVNYVRSREIVERYYTQVLGKDNFRIYSYAVTHSLHAKVYIADDMIIIGSANLTWTGMNQSVESISIMKNEKIAKQVFSKLDKLEKSGIIKRLPLQNIVGEIFYKDGKTS